MLRWWKLDDENVDEVCEDVVLYDAYGGNSCAMSFKIQILIEFA